LNSSPLSVTLGTKTGQVNDAQQPATFARDVAMDGSEPSTAPK